MPDPIVIQDSASHAATAADAATHVVSAAGGGGVLAAVLNFFTQREARRMGERVALLEGAVAALHKRLDDVTGTRAPTARITKKRRHT